MASTPQEKADLQLRYQQEFLELQNQQMRMANMQALTEREEKLEDEKRAQAFNDYILGKTKTIPQYE
ncbi:Type IV secretion system protein [compost metagenome]